MGKSSINKPFCKAMLRLPEGSIDMENPEIGDHVRESMGFHEFSSSVLGEG